MKKAILPLVILTSLLASCGQQENNQNIKNTRLEQAEALIPANITGEERTEMLHFILSVPTDTSQIKNVVLLNESDNGITSQSSSTRAITTFSTKDAVIPFQKNLDVFDNENKATKQITSQNLATCTASSRDTGPYSRRVAQNYYGGFASNFTLPDTVSIATGDTAYQYGSIRTIDQSAGVEIGFVYSEYNKDWAAYMSVNGFYPAASSNSTNYDSNGILMPLIRFNKGQTINFQIWDVTDAYNSNVFYVAGTFNGTLVGYKTTGSGRVNGLRPKESLGYSNRYSGLEVAAVTSIATKWATGVPASYSYNGKFSQMQLMTPTQTTYNFNNSTWNDISVYTNCVSNQVYVNATQPTLDSITTNIYKASR